MFSGEIIQSKFREGGGMLMLCRESSRRLKCWRRTLFDFSFDFCQVSTFLREFLISCRDR